MSINRRDMLRFTFGAAALSAVSGIQIPAFAREFPCPVGVQMFGVRKDFNADPAGTMAKLAEAGFECVEYAGYPVSIKELANIQKDTGLKCEGSHLSRPEICDPEKFKQTVENHLELGAKFMICSWQQNETIEDWANAGRMFSEAAEAAKQYGLGVGYHAHGHDFDVRENGLTNWEIFADNSSKDVIMQMDTANCPLDCLKFIAKYPGRSRSVHLKEKGGIIGKGSIDWKKVLELCETVGGVETYIIEHEPDGDGALRENIECLKALRNM